MSTQTKAPYRHKHDGSNCWTRNCSLDHVSSLQQAAEAGDTAGYLEAKKAIDMKASQKTSQTFQALEYGSENYKAFMQKSERLVEQVEGHEFKTMVEYTGWAYRHYYGYLEGKNRDGSDFGSQHDEETRKTLTAGLASGVKNLDSLIAKAEKFDKPINVFRGEKTPKGVPLAQHLASKFQVGKSVEIKQFLSTSMDPKVASEIISDDPNSYVLVIRTKEGAALGEYLSEQGLREKEIVLPRDRKYKVDRIGSDTIQWGSTRKKHTTVYLTME